jgi:CDP-diacylglycerol--glycerol-3-phosphate 3-phosphatidyltransferase
VKSALKEGARRVVEPLARGLGALGATPNGITVAGLLFSAVAGVLAARGVFAGAALLLLVGSVCDMLDGALARITGRSARFGAFLDSTVDRVAELALFAGLLVYFTDPGRSPLYALLTFLAAGGSFLVSYTRARSEGLGIECRVGLMERPERLVLLVLALLVGPPGLRIALWALNVLVWWTALQRIRHVSREAGLP